MQPITTAEGILSSRRVPHSVSASGNDNEADIINEIDTVSPSSHALNPASISDSILNNTAALLTHILPNMTFLRSASVSEDEEMNAIMSSGKHYRLAAQTLLGAKTKTATHLVPFSSLTRKQSYLLSYSLLSQFTNHVAILPTASSRWPFENTEMQEENVVTTAMDIASRLLFCTQVGEAFHSRFYPAPRVSQYPQACSKAADILDAICRRIGLSLTEKKQIVESILQRYQDVWQSQQGEEKSKGYHLMFMDIATTALSKESDVANRHYQQIRKALRRRLTKYAHLAPIRHYLDETPAAFAKQTLPVANDRVLRDYFNVTNEQIVESNFYSGINSRDVDRVILDVCDKYFRGLSDYISIPPLNQTHRVIFDLSSLRGRMIHIPKYFTTKEIFLGIHRRQAMRQSQGLFFFPHHTNLYVRFAVERRPSVTALIDRELRARLSQLTENERFKSLFESAVYFRAIGLVINAHKDNPLLLQMDIITQFLRGEISPLIVTLWQETVPHLLALSAPLATDVVYISLALGEVRVFKRDQHDDVIKAFISQHVSIFMQQRLSVSTLRPKRICHSRVYMHVTTHAACFEPVLSLAYHKHYQQALYLALVKQIEQNINSLTYTEEEYRDDMALIWLSASLDSVGMLAGILSLSVTGPVGTAILASIGIGAGVGNTILHYQIAAQTDDGTLYQNALNQAQLGAWFTALGSVVDVAFGVNMILKKFDLYKTSRRLAQQTVVQQKGARYLRRYTSKSSDTRKQGQYSAAEPKTRQHPPKGVEDGPRKYVYQDSPDFRVVKKSINPRIGSVGYRTIGDNSYVHFYTKVDKGREIEGKTLLVSAHGGFLNSDLVEQPVVLPESLTVKLLAPHNTYLEDPSLGQVINNGRQFRAFLTIKDGKSSVNFRSQTHSEWRFTEQYDPELPRNSLGRMNGLHNYRHYHFERETPEQISEVLLENRELAKKRLATPSDILVVHDRIGLISDTDPTKASLRRVIELDQQGQLVNVMGNRYNTIIFSHCRVNFLRPAWSVSTYRAVYPHTYDLRKGGKLSQVIRTTLHRDRADAAFKQYDEDMGLIAFYPVKAEAPDASTASPENADGEAAASNVIHLSGTR